MQYKYGKRFGLNSLRTGARHVSSTHGRTANFVSSARVNGKTPFMVESEAEQLVAQMLSFDPSVSEYRPQEISVDLVEGVLLYTPEQRKAASARYRDVVGPCIFTPDFVAALVNQAKRVIEVKLDSFPGDEEYEKKLQSAKSVLIRHGFEMVVAIIPADQRMPVWSNVPLIIQAYGRQDLRPSEDTFRKIEMAFDAGARVARDLTRPLGLDMKLMPSLIGSGVVSLDLLNDHIRGDAPVGAAAGDLSHLQLIDRLSK